jgi:hypothetical protein
MACSWRQWNNASGGKFSGRRSGTVYRARIFSIYIMNKEMFADAGLFLGFLRDTQHDEKKLHNIEDELLHCPSTMRKCNDSGHTKRRS